MTPMQVQRWNADRDGVLTATRIRERLEAQGLWVSSHRYGPGEALQRGPLDHDAVEVVVSGQLEVSDGHCAVVLAAGDAAFVRRGVAHQAQAVGSSGVVAYCGAFLPAGPPIVRPRLLHCVDGP